MNACAASDSHGMFGGNPLLPLKIATLWPWTFAGRCCTTILRSLATCRPASRHKAAGNPSGLIASSPASNASVMRSFAWRFVKIDPGIFRRKSISKLR